MFRLYFLKVWINSLENAIRTSKRLSTANWLRIAYVCLIISVISFLFFLDAKQEKQLTSVTPTIKELRINPSYKEVIENKFPQYSFEVISGYRTFEHQEMLFNQEITLRTGGQSYHNFGLAIDVAPINSQTSLLWKNNIQKYEMESGSNWKKKDYAHIQIPKRVLIDSVASTKKVFLNTFRLSEGGKEVGIIVGKSTASGKRQFASKAHIQEALFAFTAANKEIGNKFVIHFAGHGSYGHIGIIDNSSKEKSTFGDKPRYALLIGIDDYKYKKLSLNDTTDWKESAKTFSQNKIESAVIWENRDYSMGNLSNRSFLSLINPYNTGFEDVKRYFSIPIKSYAINVNDKSPTSLNWQFWLLLFNGIMNAIASISAIILAWVSNNRAKAEFLLKQAKDERDKLELELKIKTTELEILKSQKELDIKIPTILVTN